MIIADDFYINSRCLMKENQQDYKFVEIAYPVKWGFYRNMIVPVYKVHKIANQHRRQEMYTSMYLYSDDVFCYLKNHSVNGRQSIAGYDGKISAAYVFLDIDSPNLAVSLNAARKIGDFFINKWEVEEYGLSISFSGRKGFHIGVQSSIFDIAPSKDLNVKHTGLRRSIPGIAGVKDLSVIDVLPDKTRLWRAMDTKNSELYKIPIRVKELYELSINDIKELARRPRQERFHTDASGLIPNKEHKPVEKAVELFKSVKVRRIKKYNAVMRKQENPADLRISLCEARHRLLNTRPREG
jgi:hypothetical protein